MGRARMTIRAIFWVAALLAVAAGCHARAEMYKWVDEKGSVHFTDDLFNVPQKYLPQIKTFRELPSDKGGDIPLRRHPAGYVVDVLVNGQATARLLVDTGASKTAISPSVLQQAGAKMGVVAATVVRTANGERTVPEASVSSLSVGGIRRGPMNVLSYDPIPEFDGLLGMDFMGAYRVEILSHGPTLRLTPP